MLKKEAVWIGKEVKKLRVNSILDVSGGSWFFRNIRQYWIEKYISSNFKNQNIVRTDINNDVCSADFTKIGKFDLVFANNLLEHVKDIKKAAKNISEVVAKNGYLCVSVPRDFPRHPDPIDNMFRPSLTDLKKLFPKFKVISEKEISEFHPLTFNRYSIFWLSKTFKVTCLLLQKSQRSLLNM